MPRKPYSKKEVVTSANTRQVGGDHYKARSAGVQHWDMVALFNLDYWQGQITRYVFRWRDKAGIEDLEKARHYVDKYIEIETLRKEGKLTSEILKRAYDSLEDEE